MEQAIKRLLNINMWCSENKSEGCERTGADDEMVRIEGLKTTATIVHRKRTDADAAAN